MADRRNRRDSKLVLGMACGIFLTLLVTAGLDVAAGRGGVFKASMMPFMTASRTSDAEKPAPGRLVVPESVCDVTLDGTAATPAADGSFPIEAGSRRIELRNETGDLWVTRVQVEAGGTVSVTPEWAGELIVDVLVIPAGARLEMDGAPCASPSVVLDTVAPGPHALAVYVGADVVWEDNVTIRSGQVDRVAIAVSDSSLVAAGAATPSTPSVETPTN